MNGDYAKTWPTISCHRCRREKPRTEMTKVRLGARTVANYCPPCLEWRKQGQQKQRQTMAAHG